MKNIANNFDNLSFNDFPIDEMSLDFTLKILKIKIQGAYLKINGCSKELNDCLIKISNWQSLEISIYDHEKEEWSILNDDMVEFFKEIDEIEANREQVFLRGFGKKTGKWVEFAITKPVTQIFYSD